jgi:hypothetical protein
VGMLQRARDTRAQAGKSRSAPPARGWPKIRDRSDKTLDVRIDDLDGDRGRRAGPDRPGRASARRAGYRTRERLHERTPSCLQCGAHAPEGTRRHAVLREDLDVLVGKEVGRCPGSARFDHEALEPQHAAICAALCVIAARARHRQFREPFFRRRALTKHDVGSDGRRS